MNIAILGGSFDPPHLGHTLIAAQIKERLPIDEVWLMPCFAHSFEKNLSSPLHRLSMTKFLETDVLKASDFEIRLKRVNDTIETLELLKKQFPKDTFLFVLGSDNLLNFHKWPRWEEIIRDYQVIIFPREIALPHLPTIAKKTLQLSSIPKNITLMDAKDLVLTNISSSLIRKRIKQGLSVDLLVQKEVETYIQKHKLYL